MSDAKWIYAKKQKQPECVQYVCDRCGMQTEEKDAKDWFDFKYTDGIEMCPRCREEFQKKFVSIPKF